MSTVAAISQAFTGRPPPIPPRWEPPGAPSRPLPGIDTRRPLRLGEPLQFIVRLRNAKTLREIVDSDGTRGIRDVKENGGLVIVQDPNEAEFDSMPQSAIATGLADYILPVAEIPGTIVRYDRTALTINALAQLAVTLICARRLPTNLCNVF